MSVEEIADEIAPTADPYGILDAHDEFVKSLKGEEAVGIKSCMFQYATSHRWSTDIYHDTDLITLEEARCLFLDNLPKFIEELSRKDEGESPEMVIWINCSDNVSYGDTLIHLDDEYETDGTRLWKVTKEFVNLSELEATR